MRTKGSLQIEAGTTGLAQINGRDEISLEAKVKLDAEYPGRNNSGSTFKFFGKQPESAQT